MQNAGASTMEPTHLNCSHVFTVDTDHPAYPDRFLIQNVYRKIYYCTFCKKDDY